MRFLSSVCVGALLIVIGLWRRLISPLLGRHCRFSPTCSCYMAEALKIHGPVVGLWLGVLRIGRCNALFAGGVDPVPGRTKPNESKTQAERND